MNSGSRREWLNRAEGCRQRAALYRRVIEQAEQHPRGRGSHPRWEEVKAILLEMAEDFEHEAADSEARAAETG